MIGEIAVVAAVLIIALAFMAALAIVPHQIGSKYARRRLERALVPGEKLVFQARCTRVRLFFLIWGSYGRGTIYVTDRRVLWKADLALLPTKFEPLPIFEVEDATVRGSLGYFLVRMTVRDKEWQLTPNRFNAFDWPWGNKRIAEALRDHIVNHPQRLAVMHS